jgi:Cu/Ag efflux pump CusA
MTRQAARRAAFPTGVTAVGLALAVLPFILVGDIAGMEVVRPLALVVIGGLVSSTLVTLFLLPALHLRLIARTRSSADA